MASYVETMNLDDIESDFDNKENTCHINNALRRSPCFETVHEIVSEVKHLWSSKRNCILKKSEIVNKSDVDRISADQSELEDQSSIRVSTATIESGSSKKVSSTHFMNDHTPQEDFIQAALQTKSKLLKSPLTTSGIEEKNDNNQAHNTQASVDNETYTELMVCEELTNMISALESRVKTLEYESEDRLRKIKDLTNQISENDEEKKNIVTVLEKYDCTIATLIAELEQSKKQHAEEQMLHIENVKELTGTLSILKLSFIDLRSKYDVNKQIISILKVNIDCLTKSLQESKDDQVKIENKYELLKQHANEVINYANQDLEKLKQGHQAEVLKLQAMMKRRDLRISCLKDRLAQKTKEVDHYLRRTTKYSRLNYNSTHSKHL